MDTQSVWDILSNISIGTILAWGFVICSILATICGGTVRLYKLFTKYSSIKDENEKQKKLLQKHDGILTQLNASLNEIKCSMREQKEVNLKQVRYQIVHTCDDAIASGEISAGRLRSLEEMFEEYTDIFHGNGYVKTMVMKVRRLPVTGKLDE